MFGIWLYVLHWNFCLVLYLRIQTYSSNWIFFFRFQAMSWRIFWSNFLPVCLPNFGKNGKDELSSIQILFCGQIAIPRMEPDKPRWTRALPFLKWEFQMICWHFHEITQYVLCSLWTVNTTLSHKYVVDCCGSSKQLDVVLKASF